MNKRCLPDFFQDITEYLPEIKAVVKEILVNNIWEK